MRTRIYVDKEFARNLKILAVNNDKSVIALTKNLDVVLRDSKNFGKSKVKGWFPL